MTAQTIQIAMVPGEAGDALWTAGQGSRTDGCVNFAAKGSFYFL
jgi:hypothetical protein